MARKKVSEEVLQRRMEGWDGLWVSALMAAMRESCRASWVSSFFAAYTETTPSLLPR